MNVPNHPHTDPSNDVYYEHGPIQYFLPDQVVFHLVHPAMLAPSELARAFSAFLTDSGPETGPGPVVDVQLLTRQAELPTARPQSWKPVIEPPKEEAFLAFPPLEGEVNTFSIVPSRLRSHLEQKDLVALIKNINNDIEKEPIPIPSQTGPIRLHAASPNWLMNSASHTPATGGPGAWPVKAHLRRPDSWKFDFEAEGTGKGVYVAILDTIPSAEDRKGAYEHWHDHPLVKDLLDPNGGTLQLYPATVPQPKIDDYSLLGHRYLMADHGLFVAGIIHTIAPEAQLHLYEVLSPFGVGTIESVARGLLSVFANPKIGRPLIINCSFMLGSPRNIDAESAPDFPNELVFTEKEGNCHISELLTMSISEMFSSITQQKGVTVVAAAGNDRAKDKSRPPARYPAAFPGVLGVAALPKIPKNKKRDFKSATYSNLSYDPLESNKPAENKWITLGGEPGRRKGVLGVYIGKFPKTELRKPGWSSRRHPGHLPEDKRDVTPDGIKYYKNQTGWAWWAGTSFAAPIISGTIAAQLGQGAVTARSNTLQPDPNEPRDAEGENVFVARQK